MGFYLRKSLRVGPLRFNLSRSGIGVSAGIPGLRVGVGPRGHYVRIGSGVLKYRVSLPIPAAPLPGSGPPSPSADPQIPPGTHAPLEEVESAHYSQLADSSSLELLDELHRKRQMIRWWPLVATTFGILGLIGYLALWPSWALALIVLGGMAATVAIQARDELTKTVVLFYDFDSAMEKAFAQLHAAAENLAQCSSVWHVAAAGRVYDPKYHAGANSLVRRNRTFLRKAEPPYVKTNIETIAIGVGRQTLHFFPDRLLIYDSDGVGAVGYQDLKITVFARRFIEDGFVPSDAKVVDQTWKYVNRSGGPDRRFNNNRQLPICLYDELAFSSSSGLNEVIQVSRTGLGRDLLSAVEMLGRSLPAPG